MTLRDANRALDSYLGGEYGESPIRFAQRDSLAHSYRDELPPARPQIEPIIGGWREVREILAGLVIFGALFLGVPFLLWLVGSA